MRTWIAALAVLWALPAQAASISVAVSGTDFEGGPAFIVEMGAVPIGTGLVQAFDHPQLYSFTLPDAVLEQGETIQIRFVNDYHEAGIGDRNLIVVGVSVNGTPVADEAITVVGRDGTLFDTRVLNSASRQAIIARPEGGWPESPVRQDRGRSLSPADVR
jgi:hypothetical protein